MNREACFSVPFQLKAILDGYFHSTYDPSRDPKLILHVNAWNTCPEYLSNDGHHPACARSHADPAESQECSLPAGLYHSLCSPSWCSASLCHWALPGNLGLALISPVHSVLCHLHLKQLLKARMILFFSNTICILVMPTLLRESAE